MSNSKDAETQLVGPRTMRVTCGEESFDLDMSLQLDKRFDLLRNKFGDHEIELSPTLTIKLDENPECLAAYFKTEGLGALTFTFADSDDKIGVASQAVWRYYCLLCSDWYRCICWVKSEKDTYLDESGVLHPYKATIAGGSYEYTEELRMGYDDSESSIMRIGDEWFGFDEGDDCKAYSVTTDIQASDVELLKTFFFNDVVKY